MQKWGFVPFWETFFDATVQWVKNWWEEELTSAVLNEIRISGRILMAPWVAPIQRSFIEKLQIKPGIDPEQWLKDTVLFLQQQGIQTSPLLTINPGEFNKASVVKGLVEGLPATLVVALFRAATSPPICSSVMEDVEMLMRLHVAEAAGRKMPSRFIEMLEYRSLTSILDMEPLLKTQAHDKGRFLEEPGEGGGNATDPQKERPGQYL